MPEMTYQHSEVWSLEETGPDWLLGECQNDSAFADLVSVFETGETQRESQLSGRAR
jgi:hypothetical protein